VEACACQHAEHQGSCEHRLLPRFSGAPSAGFAPRASADGPCKSSTGPCDEISGASLDTGRAVVEPQPHSPLARARRRSRIPACPPFQGVKTMTESHDAPQRRDLFKLGGLGLVGAVAASAISAERAAAQAPRESLLRTVLNRGKLIVGTGSTNAPWHFEDERGQLTGMDIAMAKMLAKGLFDDDTKLEFVRQDPAQRIP